MSRVKVYHRPASEFLLVPNAFVRSGLKPSVRSVLLYMASHTDAWTVHTSKIGDDLDLHRNTVTRAIKDAIAETNHLIAVPTGAGKDQHANPEYVFHVSLVGFTQEERSEILSTGTLEACTKKQHDRAQESSTKKTILLEDHSELTFGVIADDPHSDLRRGRPDGQPAKVSYPYPSERYRNDNDTGWIYEYDFEECEAWLEATVGLDKWDYSTFHSMAEGGCHPNMIHNKIAKEQSIRYQGVAR